MRLNEQARGVFIIAVTPFTDSGELDLPSTDRLVEFYLERGATGLTVLGMMGEAPKLTASESLTYVEHVIERVAGRVPVVAGASGAGLAPMAELARQMMQAGAAGVMVAPPSHLRSDDQLVNYYTQVGQAIGRDTPFVLQDFPLATSVQIPVQAIVRIVNDNPNCVMLKHEDWPGLEKISALRQAEAEGRMRRISILAGNGGLFLPEELGRGADGAMTGFGYPEMMAGVYAAHTAGDAEKAHDLFDAYLPLARYEQQPGLGLAIRKYVLARRGAISSSAIRLPGAKLSPADIGEIEHLIERQESRLQEMNR
ncbi:dihydrodipicolinate synthase family protein [Stutzerimonas kirkiae]|nr:dihydrodipicolinate synthase family protein [Stutzerimonas kirkiae]